jgi:4a-hydroxytetrahydrobiopterin dehydratase
MTQYLLSPAVVGHHPADEQNHHPDVAIHWNVVTLTFWTHASGGITERDFRLAAAIEGILSSPSGRVWVP